MQTLALHRAMGLVAGTIVAGVRRQAVGLSPEHRKASIVAVSVVEPDTTCTAGVQLHVSAKN